LYNNKPNVFQDGLIIKVYATLN